MLQPYATSTTAELLAALGAGGTIILWVVFQCLSIFPAWALIWLGIILMIDHRLRKRHYDSESE